MKFDTKQQVIVNSFIGKLKEVDKIIARVESYYRSHDDELTRYIRFNKSKIGTDEVFTPIPGYYLITDGIRITGVGEMKKDPSTGKLFVPQRKYLPPKKYNAQNLQYLNDYIHGDYDNDGIPNVDDLFPHVPSDTSAEEVSLSRNIQEINVKRRKLKFAMLAFKNELSPVTDEYKSLIRVKTPVSIINKLHSKSFVLEDPRASVIKDAIGGMIIVNSMGELKQIENFIDTRFKGRILEKDDKYKHLKTTWCLENFKVGDKTVFRASEKCDTCETKCEMETKEYGGMRTYTALHYSILVQDGEGTAIIAELQVKTKLTKKLSDWVHGMYKERSKKYNELFQFLYDVAEQADMKSKAENKPERTILRFFYRIRENVSNVVLKDPSYYIPKEIIAFYYEHGKKLPTNLNDILEAHEKKIRKK